MKIDYSLMYVTDLRLDDQQYFSVLEDALKGGASIIQLREKNLGSKAFYEKALRTKSICDRYHVPLIINDRVDIALAVDAAGIHVGQTDLPVSIVRQMIGEDKILGLSVGTLAQAEASKTAPIDYIGVSPIFGTNTKTDELEPPLELAGLQRIREMVDYPIVCIGGINEENAASIIENGSDGLAVITAISAAKNPFLSTKNLKSIVCQAGTNKQDN